MSGKCTWSSCMHLPQVTALLSHLRRKHFLWHSCHASQWSTDWEKDWHKICCHHNIWSFFSDASKAAFTASPSSCFLANRNKAGTISSDTSVKNECLMEPTYFSLSTNQHSGITSGLSPFSTGNNETMQLTGRENLFPGPPFSLVLLFLKVAIWMKGAWRKHHIVLQG